MIYEQDWHVWKIAVYGKVLDRGTLHRQKILSRIKAQTICEFQIPVFVTVVIIKSLTLGWVNHND